MYTDPTSVTSSVTTSVLLSGALGAFVASVIATAASLYIDRKNKKWTLKAELRRHAVSRMSQSVGIVRLCFFTVLTHLEYHHLNLEGLEYEGKFAPGAPLIEQIQGLAAAQLHAAEHMRCVSERIEEERIRYNARMFQVEADAKSNVAVLANGFIPVALVCRVQEVLFILTSGQTTDAASTKLRIELFTQHQALVLSLLAECDAIIADEIASEIQL